MFYYQNKKGGFTLVEIIVSLAVFMIVAMVALSALVRIISANRKAQAMQESITDLNFTLEAMSREMRVGQSYSCYSADSFSTYSPSDKSACLLDSADRVIAFASSHPAESCMPANQHNKAIAYKFEYDSTKGVWSVQRAKEEGCDGIDTNDFHDVLSPSISIKNFSSSVKYLNGVPFAFVRLSGEAGVKEKEKTFFDIQTAVSSRFTK